MKKSILFIIIFGLCFVAFVASFNETAVTEAPGTEAPAAEMTPEELYQTGIAALGEQDYGNAMKYFQLAADAGNFDGWRGIGNLYANGDGVEQDYGKALEYFNLAAEQGDAKSFYNLGLLYQYKMSVFSKSKKLIFINRNDSPFFQYRLVPFLRELHVFYSLRKIDVISVGLNSFYGIVATLYRWIWCFELRYSSRNLTTWGPAPCTLKTAL